MRSTDLKELDARRASLLLWRGMRRRCPNCGQSGLFRRWVRIRHACPTCHLKLDRGEDDYFIGGFAVNFLAAELVVVVAALAAILLTWPDVPWTALEVGLLLLVVPFPVLTYPFAKTLWLAMDLWLRPVRLADLAGHGENETAARGGEAPEPLHVQELARPTPR